MPVKTYLPLSAEWAALAPGAHIIILTEPARMDIARAMARDNAAHHPRILDIDRDDWQPRLAALTPADAAVVLLTIDAFMQRGWRDHLSPFSKPAYLAAKYLFIRLDIPAESLLDGLHTPRADVLATLAACAAYRPGTRLRVTAPGGTDLTVLVAAQECLPWDASAPGGHAFLPPAEVSEDITDADGTIVCDITAGELRFGPDLIAPLGLVDAPVRLTVRHGLVTAIDGGDIARRLAAGLARLDPALQTVVELGHGLSAVRPTGIIGVDEGMLGTCHFGIGSRNPYHVDLVVRAPQITVLEE